MNAINSLHRSFDRSELRRACVRAVAAGAALVYVLTAMASARQFSGLGSAHDVLIESDVLADTPGHFGRIGIGDVTGDLRADAVLMIGQQPVLLYGVGCDQSVATLPFTARDIAFLRETPTSSLSRIVTTDATGLHLWGKASVGPGFVPQMIGTPGRNAQWSAARNLATGDLDADGRTDVIAIRSQSNRLIMLLDPTGDCVQRSPVFPFTIDDFVLLDFCDGPQLEIAMLTSAGIVIVLPDATVVAQYAMSAQDGTLVALEYAGGAHARLGAIVRDKYDDNELLYVIDSAGVEPALALGPIHVVAAAAGDLDFDGLPELALSQQSTHETWLFFHQSSGASFTTAPSGLVMIDQRATPGAAPENFASVAIGDLDNDGDADLLVPVQSTFKVLPVTNRARKAIDAAPRIETAEFTWLPGPTAAASHGDLDLVFSAPNDPPPQCGGLEITVWMQSDALSHVEPTAMQHRVVQFEEPFAWPLAITLSLPGALSLDQIDSIQVRLIDGDALLGITSVAPTITSAFAVDGTSLDALIAQQPTPPIVLAVDVNGVSGSGDIEGGIILLSKLPKIEDDFFPDEVAINWY